MANVGDVVNITVRKGRTGIPVLSILLIALVILKVLGKIQLAWVWVLLPLWMLPALVVGAMVIILLIAIAAIVAELIANR
jgi:hypothetical protein